MYLINLNQHDLRRRKTRARVIGYLARMELYEYDDSVETLWMYKGSHPELYFYGTILDSNLNYSRLLLLTCKRV